MSFLDFSLVGGPVRLLQIGAVLGMAKLQAGMAKLQARKLPGSIPALFSRHPNLQFLFLTPTLVPDVGVVGDILHAILACLGSQFSGSNLPMDKLLMFLNVT